MDWGSRCLRGLVARELSSDDSENKWGKKIHPNQSSENLCKYGGKAAEVTAVSPVLLCSASSVAICMRASSTRALSSQVYQSSSSCRKFAPVASDTFLVASLHSRSMKPGMFSRVTIGKIYNLLIPSSQWHTIHYTVSLTTEDNLPWLTSAREGLALRFCWAFLAKRVCLSSLPTSGSEMVTDRMRQKLASCCWSKLWTRPDRLGIPSNWIIS